MDFRNSNNEEQDIYEKCPCRNDQINLLKSVLQTGTFTYSLILYGRPATGKSFVISHLLTSLKAKFVVVNCAECDTGRLLYELILDEITGHRASAQNGFKHFARVDVANDFIRHLQSEVIQKLINDRPLYIVLKNGEMLRKLSGNIITVFLQLRELSQVNVTAIFLSGVYPEKLCPLSKSETFSVYFPEYTKDEVIKILLKDCPKTYSAQFYSNYLQLVLSVFYSACRNLREIRYLVSENFSTYTKPISNGELTEFDVKKLWRNVEPHLKSNLHQMHLRESSRNSSEASSVGPDIGRIELPFYSKYLLIAAYLASYNPAKLDNQLFLKKHEKVSKRIKLRKQKGKTVQYHLLGPKQFPLERMMAIFCSIVDDSNASSYPILSQIASLVSLNFLQRVGINDIFDTPKFKCLVSLDAIRTISQSVDFSVDKYLYDFI